MNDQTIPRVRNLTYACVTSREKWEEGFRDGFTGLTMRFEYYRITDLREAYRAGWLVGRLRAAREQGAPV